MTNRIIPDESYYDVAPTTRLDPPGCALDRYLPENPLPLLLALLPTLAAAYKLGALLGPLDPYRGWAALVVLSIVVPIAVIYTREVEPCE